MKKLISLILVLINISTLISCGQKNAMGGSEMTENTMADILNKAEILTKTEAFGLRKLEDKIGHNDYDHTNKDETLTRGQWLENNIPFIETPDELLDRVYYFRWNNLLSNLVKRKSDGKYEFTESSELGSYHKYIDCAQGHHLLDARWIRDTKYLNDYIDGTPDKDAYWNFLIDSVLKKYYLDGDLDVIRRNYDKLKSRFHSRDGKYDSKAGLYYLQMGSEGQEAGVNGFERIERESVYRASYSAPESSIKAIKDNITSGSFWSSEGRNSASIEITMANEGAIFKGVRLWFKSGKQIPKITVLTSDYVANEVEGAKIVSENDAMVEISFTKTEGDIIKLEFENASDTDDYAALYEIALIYEYPSGTSGFWKVLGGDDSYRVSANSYMAAAAKALSEMATLLGEKGDAKKYADISDKIVSSLLNKLWDENDSFFIEMTKSGKIIVGKESNRYAPWAFGLIPDTEVYAEAWKYLMDENVFLAKYGITSLEQGNPHFMQSFNHGCLWNGPVWPYTYSLVLTAMAEHLRSETVTEVDAADYYELLKRYCLCHFESGSTKALALRENHHPTENKWIAKSPDYNHSSFIDNVLSGLMGIRPTEDGLEIDPIVPADWEYFCVEDVKWHGKDVTIVYDKTGERYGLGKGYKVFLHGKLVFSSETVKAHKISA